MERYEGDQKTSVDDATVVSAIYNYRRRRYSFATPSILNGKVYLVGGCSLEWRKIELCTIQ